MTQEISLLELHDSVNKLGSDLTTHMKIETLNAKHHSQMLNDTREDIKDYKLHVDMIIKETQNHFDNKLIECNNDMMSLLSKEHYDRLQMDAIITKHEKDRRNEVTKAVLASEKRQFTKIKWFGFGVAAVATVIGFIAKNIDIIKTVLNSGK